MLGLNEMRDQAHKNACDKGWWDADLVPANPETLIPEKLCLMHSEVSEALECYRDPEHRPNEAWRSEKGKPEGLPAELADVIIRIGDFCGYFGIDIETAVREKMAFNATRPHRHGGKRA